MIRTCLALICLSLPASAQTLCDDLDTLQSDSLVLPQGTATCRSSLAQGGERNMHCALEFPYRSQAATDAFDALVAELASCLGQGATMTTDQSVNHPDAYDLREFVLDGRRFAVSIKDKGALQQTLVFVRVQLQ